MAGSGTVDMAVLTGQGTGAACRGSTPGANEPAPAAAGCACG
ncbi:hypothetical protein [Kitasatospora sp. NBC_01302]|nr:hypothetical protein OG294_24085 [Kitasatospora sp. NBC_01302]